MLDILFKRLHPSAKQPIKNHQSDAGFDFFCVRDETFYKDGPDTNLVYTKYLGIGDRHLFHTGIAIELPLGYCLYFIDRSGMGGKRIIHRTGGLIDETFRGELLVSLINLSREKQYIHEGDKIIQGILISVPQARFMEVQELSQTERGEKCFGSSDFLVPDDTFVKNALKNEEIFKNNFKSSI